MRITSVWAYHFAFGLIFFCRLRSSKRIIVGFRTSFAWIWATTDCITLQKKRTVNESLWDLHNAARKQDQLSFVSGRLKGKGKGKVTLFNVGSSFSYETGINGSRRCALYPPASVSAPFYGYSKLWLHGSEENRNRRWSHWRSNRRPLAQKAAH